MITSEKFEHVALDWAKIPYAYTICCLQNEDLKFYFIEWNGGSYYLYSDNIMQLWTIISIDQLYQYHLIIVLPGLPSEKL